jgi:carboxypeptidase C (cathepsin A)
MKGFIIGSPWIDTITQSYSSEYMYYVGLIDGKQAEEINELESAFEDAIKANATEDASRISSMLYAGPNALYPKYTGYQNFQSALATKESQEIYRFQEFLDSDEMHTLLHVGLRKFNGVSIKTAEKFAGNFFTLNSTGLVEDLLEKGYSVLLYSPQFDLFNSHLGIKVVLSNLKWKGSEEFEGAKRTFWKVKEDIAGYVTAGGNLTFVLVRNAGNNALQDQPEWTYDMVEKFLQGKQF